LTNVTNLIDKQQNVDEARLKLQDFLQLSTDYRVQFILGRLKPYESVLQKELAILYGKLNEHDKALGIFVYTLEDYSAATNYCLLNSKNSIEKRKKLFNLLFSIYMNPKIE
jgi:vacuolar protein sorting-associated protein 3